MEVVINWILKNEILYILKVLWLYIYNNIDFYKTKQAIKMRKCKVPNISITFRKYNIPFSYLKCFKEIMKPCRMV